nr:T9SS type A sorting domain-containing protein [uncultured Chryseobacterium sp.]
MKKIYLIIFVLIFSACKTQIINIPDSYLKAKLLTYGATSNAGGTFINVDTNGDGEIQVSEAALVYKISISNLNDTVSSLAGLTSFPNLTELEFSNPNLSSYNLTFNNYPVLQKLKIVGGTVNNVTIENCNALFSISLDKGNIVSIQNTTAQEIKIENINGLNLSSTPNLKKFSLFSSELSSLNLSNHPLLEEVSVTENNFLTNINFSGDTALKKLELHHNQLSSLTVPNPALVNYISIGFNLFQIFDATPYTGLVFFYGHENQITGLDFSSSPLIGQIYVYNNSLSTLTLFNNNNLQLLYANNNQLNNVAFNHAKNLKNIQITNNNLTDIDLSKNVLLEVADLDFNPNLQTLNIKNGKHNNLGLGFSNTPQLQYVCTDPNETSFVISQLATYNQPNTVVNSYCTMTPGGAYYTLQGTTRYDMNGNGCDNNDTNKPFQKFNILGQSTAISSSAGTYSVALTPGPILISPVLENPSYFNITPSLVNLNLPAQTTPFTQNFCLTANGNHNDLEVVILPITLAIPGFDAQYKIIYKNKGTAAQSGTLLYNFDDNLMNFLTSSYSLTSQTTGILSWNFTNLLPFETREINLTFKLNTPLQTPPLNGGHILSSTFQINGLADETPADNIFTLNQTVVNSIDPNDKTCLEGTTITQAKVGDYVHYLIRFENTGTANAQHVVVKDVIDTSKFDISTLQAISGSHNFISRITGTNIVEFVFENIQLPFDNALNDGYVSFKIKTKSNLNAGDSFSNTADIYFDYNAPVITNTYTTTVQNTLGTTELSNDKINIYIYPNPVNDMLYVKTKVIITKAEIYDTTGRIILSTGLKNNSADVSNLSEGNYIVKFFTQDKTVTQKFIKN